MLQKKEKHGSNLNAVLFVNLSIFHKADSLQRATKLNSLWVDASVPENNVVQCCQYFILQGHSLWNWIENLNENEMLSIDSAGVSRELATLDLTQLGCPPRMQSTYICYFIVLPHRSPLKMLKWGNNWRKFELFNQKMVPISHIRNKKDYDKVNGDRFLMNCSFKRSFFSVPLFDSSTGDKGSRWCRVFLFLSSLFGQWMMSKIHGKGHVTSTLLWLAN